MIGRRETQIMVSRCAVSWPARPAQFHFRARMSATGICWLRAARAPPAFCQCLAGQNEASRQSRKKHWASGGAASPGDLNPTETITQRSQAMDSHTTSARPWRKRASRSFRCPTRALAAVLPGYPVGAGP